MKTLFLPVLATLCIPNAFAEKVSLKVIPEMSEVTCLAATKDGNYTIGGQSYDGNPQIDCWGYSFKVDNSEGSCIAISQSDIAIAVSNGKYGLFSPLYDDDKFIELILSEGNKVISFNDIADDSSIAIGNMENNGRIFPFAWYHGIDCEIYVPEEIEGRPGYSTVEMTACSADGKRLLGNIVYEDGTRNFVILDKTSDYDQYPAFDFNPAGDDKIRDLKIIDSFKLKSLTATAMSQDGNWIAVMATAEELVDGRTELAGRYDVKENVLQLATLYIEEDSSYIPTGIDNNGMVVGRTIPSEAQDEPQESGYAWIWNKEYDSFISALSHSFGNDMIAELEPLDRYSNHPYGVTMSEEGDSEYIFGSYTNDEGMKSGYIIEIDGIGTSVDRITADDEDTPLEVYDICGRRLNLKSLTDMDGRFYKRHGNKAVIIR